VGNLKCGKSSIVGIRGCVASENPEIEFACQYRTFDFKRRIRRSTMFLHLFQKSKLRLIAIQIAAYLRGLTISSPELHVSRLRTLAMFRVDGLVSAIGVRLPEFLPRP
jgi:hypothetical protein